MNIPPYAWPLAVCIVGALVFALAKDKASVLGKDAFWVGLLVLLAWAVFR